jgi:hypothetical protein
MRITKWYILAGGSATRWEGYQGVKNKCYVEVDGETLLDRTEWLLRSNGIENIEIVLEGYESKREAFEGIAREAQCPFGILLGDCYYTEEIIKDAVNKDVDTWKHYYNCLPNKWTGCPWEEGYIHLVPNWEWWLEKMTEFNQKCDNGEINFVKDFQIDRYLRGYSPDEYRGATLDEHDIFWNDRTDDFDYPVDYDKFMATKGANRDYLTVILPLWNASEWGGAIMQQLATQKQLYYPETELIAIDDGSTDSLEYTKVPGWQVIHQPNKGVAAARNIGLMAATGDYISFVDADDIVEGNYLHNIYQNMRKGYDVVVYPWYFADGQKADAHGDLIPNWAVWGYSFSRKAINGERFDESLNVSEDIDWLRRVVTEDKKRLVSDTAIYRYDWDKNPNSLSKRFNRGELPKDKVA